MTSYIFMSANGEWPGFSKSRPFTNSIATKFATAIHNSNCSIFAGQEFGRAQAALLAPKLGSNWSYQRSQGTDRMQGLNVLFWNEDEWKQYADTIDRNIRSYGQAQRTAIAVPLQHRVTKQKILAGTSHFANRSAAAERELNVSPSTAQANQAADVHNLATTVDEPAIFGIDSNSPNASYGGRAALIRRKWKTQANGVDIVAWQRGIEMVGKGRTISIPADHNKGVIITFNITETEAIS